MKEKQRHMKIYKPRRRRSDKGLQKQQLKEFEHLLEMDLSSFLILSKEGTKRQMDQAKIKMRSDLLKYGSDMEAIGRDIGEGLPEIVREYIKGIKEILEDGSKVVDLSLLNEHRHQAEKIRKIAG